MLSPRLTEFIVSRLFTAIRCTCQGLLETTASATICRADGVVKSLRDAVTGLPGVGVRARNPSPRRIYDVR